MGSTSSKKSPRVVHTRSDEVNENGERSERNAYNINNSDKHFIEIMKKELSETPELFVLNNIVMIVMFFENYKKLLKKVEPKRHERDQDFIVPDVLLEEVNKNVMFCPVHGPKKEKLVPLVPKRIFVMNNDIKVISSTESNEDAGSGTVRIEESPRKGYVRLREIRSSAPLSSSSTPQQLSEPTSRTSTDSSDTLYGYASLNDLKTPKPLEILQVLNRQQVLTLPKTCISYRKIKKPCLDLDDLNEVTEDDLLETVSYISSTGFMQYFESYLILDNVIAELGFNEENIHSAEVVPGKVFCNLTENGISTPCEIIPSILAKWPREQTLAFFMKGGRKPIPGKRQVFPTAGMIDEISKMQCNLIPKGFFKKRGEHSDIDIEWELGFPQAERYLESYMSHAQIKGLLILLTLHKTYIEPKTAQLGILAEHIRSFMLSECESNYSEWPEHRLGTKLIKVIKNLVAQLQQARPCIPDFFIEDRNVLENVPKKYIRAAQKVFNDILQSPLTYFMDALRNLRYTTGEHFFRPVDFKKIHQILTGNTVASPSYRKAPREVKKYEQKFYADTDTRLRHINELENRKLMNQKKEEERMKLVSEDVDGRRESVNSIDVDWHCEPFDLFRKRALLIFFIEALIGLAEKSLQISTLNQTRLFLKQAVYLTIILKEQSFSFTDEVEEFSRKLKDLEGQCNLAQPGGRSDKRVALNIASEDNSVIRNATTRQKTVFTKNTKS